VEFRLTVEVKTSLAIGSGPQTRGGVCSIARDQDGLPIIPASTIKGVLRSHLERLVTDGCERTGTAACGAASCPVCNLFGGTGRSGLLRFADARLVDDDLKSFLSPLRRGAAGVEVRGGASISRSSRTPAEIPFVKREVTAPFMSGMRLQARLDASRELETNEVSLLQAAVAAVTDIGGERSRGAGQVTLRLEGPVSRSAAVAGATTSDMRLVLTAREPFRTGSGQQARHLDRIGGGSLRGALAAAVLSQKQLTPADALFVRAFAQGELRVTDAIPSGRRVVPATLMTCEIHPGFHLRQGPRVPRSLWSHGAWDTLLVEFLSARLAGKRPSAVIGRCPLDSDADTKSCPGHLVRMSQPFVTERLADEQTAAFSAVLTRSAVNRVTHRASRSDLAAVEVTLPGRGVSRYEAQIHASMPELTALLSGVHELQVGSGRSQGHGLFEMRLETWELPPVKASMQAFEEAVAKLLAGWTGGAVTRTDAGIERQRLAVIDLVSDWVPSYWADTLAETVKQDLSMVPGLEVLATRLTTGSTSGWNQAAGIPKPLRRTLGRGGVVLIGFPVVHEAEVTQALETLVKEGVGMLKAEGFGQVCVSDPVHWERVPPLMEGR
jgi:CRISPR-associated Csx10 family RAMP protein